jgi:N-acetylmuramoyl-L-alanine amidase CwlA
MQIFDDILDENIFSRPGKLLDRVEIIVVHGIGNPGQGPRGARDYWNGLKNQNQADLLPDISASAHAIIGFDGSALRTIPEIEKAFHCGGANYTAIAKELLGSYCSPDSSPNRVALGVEFCHPGGDGKPLPATEAGLIEYVRDLCIRYNRDPGRHVRMHGEITGKVCPKWYFEHPEEWARFLRLLRAETEWAKSQPAHIGKGALA